MFECSLLNIIHIICIPIITATFLALLAMIPMRYYVSGYEIGVFHIGIVLALLYYLRIGVGAFVNNMRCRQL
jgi:uncharacterized membrane protein YGL010W